MKIILICFEFAWFVYISPMILLKNNRKRTQWLLCFLGANFLVAIALLICYIMQYELIWRVMDNLVVSESEAKGIPTILQMMKVFNFFLFYTTAIFFLLWFRRAYHNMLQVGAYLSYKTDGWAIGVWFMPILNLYKPYSLMKELFAEAESYLHEKQKGMVLFADSRTLIILWWCLWIASRIIAVVLGQGNKAYHDLKKLKFFTEFGIFDKLFQMVLIVVTFKMVWDYSKLEQQVKDVVESENQQEEIRSGLMAIESPDLESN